MHCYSFIDDKMLTEDCYVVALPHMRFYDFFIFIYKCKCKKLFHTKFGKC